MFGDRLRWPGGRPPRRELADAEKSTAALRAELAQLTSEREVAEQDRADLLAAVADLKDEFDSLRSLKPIDIRDMDIPQFLIKEPEKMGTRLHKLDTGAVRYWAREKGMDIAVLMKLMIRAYIPQEAYLASIAEQVADLEQRIGTVRPARGKGTRHRGDENRPRTS